MLFNNIRKFTNSNLDTKVMKYLHISEHFVLNDLLEAQRWVQDVHNNKDSWMS